MPRPSPYPTAEACGSLRLDINLVMRRVADARRQGVEGMVAVEQRMGWARRGEDEPWAWVNVLVEAWPDSADATLRFDIDHVSRSTGPQVQRVGIASVPCNYGGVRWHWVCPATGRHVRGLYLPNGGTRFLSRAAYKLRWLTTCSTKLAKSHIRLERIAKKLGAEYRGFTHEPPPRPKWMRWWTYERLAAEWRAAAARHDAVWYAGAERTLARIEEQATGTGGS
jgi:hypothetical protein